jgi:DNA-binding NarL/FixJ family response regulator
MSESILIVEDEPPMQERLQRVLASLGHVNGSLHCAGTIAQGKALASKTKYAMALVDLGLPDGSGIKLISWLRAQDEALPILVISAWSTEEMILGALRAGASGYVLKERDDLEIAVSLTNVLKGGAPIDPFIARRILGLINTIPSAVGQDANIDEPDTALRHSLTERELAILTHVARGMSNREIAETVNLSRWTVDTHIRHIYNKLAVNSRTQAVREAHAHGLLR